MALSNNLSETCLLLVDVQKDFWSTYPLIRESFPKFPENITRLLQICRRRGIEVIHIRAVYNDEVSPWLAQWKVNNPDKKADVVDAPEPFGAEQDGEKIVHKSTFDGFLNTDLEGYLKSKGKKQVLVAGLITSACVLFTLGGAYFRGYQVLLVDSCCGDRSQQIHGNMVSRYATGYISNTIALDELDV